MDADGALEVLRDSLRQIAPEVDLSTADHDEPLLDELELDSMDFLSLVTELHDRTGLPIPESDYHRFETVTTTIRYLTDAT